MGFNKIIGSTYLDLEDRYFGNSYVSQNMMLLTCKKFIDEQIEITTETGKRDWLNAVKRKIKAKQFELKESKPLAPIEYRPLNARGKKTAQGMLEMFVEVLDTQTSKLVPVSKIAKPLPEKYELRLIIWKCEKIPMREKETIDLYFKVQFDPSGWLGESHERETDCHAGSEDGHGVYN